MVFLLTAFSCQQVSEPVIIRGRDTFQTKIDTQLVLSSEKIRPRNIHEEISPVYRTITSTDTFESRMPYQKGSHVVFSHLKK